METSSSLVLLLPLLLVAQGTSGQECDNTYGNYFRGKSGEVKCDWRWKDPVTGRKSCYVLVQFKVNFEMAENYCFEHVDGGHLASPARSMENHYIRAKLMEKFSKEVENDEPVHVWLGAQRPARNSTWKFTTGRSVDYTDWLRDDKTDKTFAVDIKNYGYGYDNGCATLFAQLSSHALFHWITEPCTEKHAFLCQY